MNTNILRTFFHIKKTAASFVGRAVFDGLLHRLDTRGHTESGGNGS